MVCTFDFYLEQFGGAVIQTEEEFRRHEKPARVCVDTLTQFRIKGMDDIPVEAANAVCAAAECAARAEQTGGRLVASETVSKHSVTFSNAGETLQDEMMRTAMLYLSGSPLIYRGGRWGTVR